MSSAREFDCGFLFECLYEFRQIAVIRGANCEHVNVIGHHAIGMNEKVTSSAMFPELGDDPVREARIRPKATPIVEAECNKVETSPAVILSR